MLSRIKFSRNLLVIPLVIVVALLLVKFKGVFVAATVNGKPISRLSVLKELEKEGGKSVLDNLITNSLILQEAQKEKVTVTSQEITDQINQISNNLKSQGQDLNAALAAQGMTQNDLKDQIKLKLSLDKMAGKDINITDDDAQKYFKDNQSTYPKNTKFETVKEDIKTTLKNQKLSEAEQTFLASLKTKAKINYFVNY